MNIGEPQRTVTITKVPIRVKTGPTKPLPDPRPEREPVPV